ncbi:MAG: sec-independent protein translocase protein TatA [Kribbellaceae bacterium]|jgi:sec-independent protein translocase protein TatA|nr:sec-independent protein translocase protein TatA [Kribbellaceae bacterium]
MASLLALPEGGEWIVLLVIVVLIFGANKLPDLTRNAAKALVEFRKLSDKPEPAPDKPQTTEENKPQL